MKTLNFPVLKKNKIIYFDNASTTQKPKEVIDSVTDFYENNYSNVHRGMYDLGENATRKFEETREIISNFFNCQSKEVIFTKNTTESINLVARGILPLIKENKNEIVLTEMEHHANIVPWQELAKRLNLKVRYIKLKEDFSLDYKDAEEKINSRTLLVSFTHKSNVLGIVNNIEKLISLAKKYQALTLMDAAQTITSKELDVKKLDLSFLVFSGHKAFGPTGTGVLYGKKELLEKMTPSNFGGNMISKVSFEKSEWNDLPNKFEAGTPSIAEIVGLGDAINFIRKLKQENIEKHERELTEYALKKLKENSEIKIYGKDQSGIISFSAKNIHPHDIACLMNDKKICMRAGFHCAMPLVKKLNEQGVCRISFSIYNTKKEIDIFCEHLKKSGGLFNNGKSSK